MESLGGSFELIRLLVDIINNYRLKDDEILVSVMILYRERK